MLRMFEYTKVKKDYFIDTCWCHLAFVFIFQILFPPLQRVEYPMFIFDNGSNPSTLYDDSIDNGGLTQEIATLNISKSSKQTTDGESNSTNSSSSNSVTSKKSKSKLKFKYKKKRSGKEGDEAQEEEEEEEYVLVDWNNKLVKQIFFTVGTLVR